MNPSLSLGTSKSFDSITGTGNAPILVYDGSLNTDPQITNLGGLSLKLSKLNDQVLIEGNLPVFLNEIIGLQASIDVTIAGTTTNIPLINLNTGLSLIPLDATVKVYRGTSATGTPIYTETKTIAAQEINIAALINSILTPTTPAQELFYDVIPFQFVDDPNDSCNKCCPAPCNNLCSNSGINADYFVTLEVSQNITDTLLTDLINQIKTGIDSIFAAILALVGLTGIVTIATNLNISISTIELYLESNYSVVAQEVAP